MLIQTAKSKIVNRCIEVRPPEHICGEWNTT
jgi:hypothetical protein